MEKCRNDSVHTDTEIAVFGKLLFWRAIYSPLKRQKVLPMDTDSHPPKRKPFKAAFASNAFQFQLLQMRCCVFRSADGRPRSAQRPLRSKFHDSLRLAELDELAAGDFSKRVALPLPPAASFPYVCVAVLYRLIVQLREHGRTISDVSARKLRGKSRGDARAIQTEHKTK